MEERAQAEVQNPLPSEKKGFSSVSALYYESCEPETLLFPLLPKKKPSNTCMYVSCKELEEQKTFL